MDEDQFIDAAREQLQAEVEGRFHSAIASMIADLKDMRLLEAGEPAEDEEENLVGTWKIKGDAELAALISKRMGLE